MKRKKPTQARNKDVFVSRFNCTSSASRLIHERRFLKIHPYFVVFQLCIFLYTTTVQVALGSILGSIPSQQQVSNTDINSKDSKETLAKGIDSLKFNGLVNSSIEKTNPRRLFPSEQSTSELTDGDINTYYAPEAVTLVELGLTERRALTGISVYGDSDYRLSLEGRVNGQWYKVSGLEAVDLRVSDDEEKPNTNGWRTLSFPQMISDGLRLRLEPLANKSSIDKKSSMQLQGIAELRVLTGDDSVKVSSVSILSDQGEFEPSSTLNRVYRVSQSLQRVNRPGALSGSRSAQFTFDIGYHPDEIASAQLEYTLLGVSKGVEVVRRINDELALGGLLSVSSDSVMDSKVVRQDERIVVSGLRMGRNHLYFQPVEGLDYQVLDVGLRLELRESAVTKEPELVLTYPRTGEYMGDWVYVRGYVDADASGVYPQLMVAGERLEVINGLYEAMVRRVGDKKLVLQARWPDGAQQTLEHELVEDLGLAGFNLSPLAQRLTTTFVAGLDTTAVLTNRVYGSFAVSAQRLETVSSSIDTATAGGLVVSGGVLTIPSGSVSKPMEITGMGLRERDLASLELGMVNVTGTVSGYRFLPHGMHFDTPIKVSLPYNKSLIPPGYNESDIHTYYFDEVAGSWVRLARTLVNEKTSRIESESNHFTDMINAVVQVPDSPQAGIYNPTQFSGMQAANPASKVNQIAPPGANNKGDAVLSYPIEIPPGRAGMQPGLALQYNSSSGNGWTGLGWDLQVPSIRVDTRWGVPRFDGGLETETYLFNGQQLAPIAHQGAPVGRVSDREFRLRVEGGFLKLIRHGGSPLSYWWEVIDKDGTHWYYGGVGAAESDATLSSANGIGVWALTLVEDSNGNQVDYQSVKVSDIGQPGGSVSGETLYIDRIDYTGHRSGGAGVYSVEFIRRSGRLDVMIDGRYGFKHVVADLLSRVEVKYNGGLVRAYELGYIEGAFHKQLLASITQLDASNAVFNTHQFSYYDEARTGSNSYYGYVNPSDWDTGGDNVEGDLIIDSEDDASAISGNEDEGYGVHLYLGFNETLPLKSNSFGVKVGYGSTDGEGLLSLIDINGDNLADKVFRDGSTVYYRPNLSGPSGGTTFGAKQVVSNMTKISDESSHMLSYGVEAYVGGGAFGGFAGVNKAETTSVSRVFLSDVNGDGLIDLVDNGSVLYNRLTGSSPSFAAGTAGTPNPISSGATLNPALLTGLQSSYNAQLNNYPLIDSLRRWEAPYNGVINISGSPCLAPVTDPKADGVRVAVEHEGNELWSSRILPNGVNPTVGGLNTIAVNKGDIIYFRVQSVMDGAQDEVSWDPRIAYSSINGVAVGSLNTIDENGVDMAVYQASDDFTLAGYQSVQYGMPNDGVVRVAGTVEKTGVTSDNVNLQILKNAAVIVDQPIAYNATGSWVLNEAVPVVESDELQVRLRYDSPIDLSKITWSASDNLRIYYESSPTINPLVDADGDPTVQIDLMADADLYSESNLTQPLKTTFVKNVGTTPVEAVLNLTTAAGASGLAYLLVKKRNQLIKKIPFTANTGTQRFNLAGVPKGDDYYFQVATRDAELGSNITASSLRLEYNTVHALDDHAANLGLYYTAEPVIVQSPNRGWSVFGYNGNPPRDTQPVMITQSDLTLGNTFDPTNPSAAQTTITTAISSGNPSPSGVTSPSSQLVQAYTSSILNQNLSGPGSVLGAGAVGSSSSRLGATSLPIPSPSAFTGAVAGIRVSEMEQLAIAAGAGGGPVTGSVSISDGESKSILEYLDLNGDLYPDIISETDVQYTLMNGALDSRTVPLNGIRDAETEVFGFGIGGNFAHKKCGSSSGCDALGFNGEAAQQAQQNNSVVDYTGYQSVEIGISGNISEGESETQTDLIDINGDGLADKVRRTGGQLKVSLNVGYEFLPEEDWGVGEINQGESESKSIGASLGFASGFNDGIYGFGGGVNVSKNESESLYTLLDVNGDGLKDRVQETGGASITVGLNTGNQFMPDINWPTGQAEGVAFTSSTNEGAGVYFTIGIPLCVVGCYLIINPGADIHQSVGRAETSINDVNGDGYPDYIHSTKDSSMTVSLAQIERTNLLNAVSRPLGSSISLEYTRDGNTFEQPNSRWVLTRVSTDDGFAGDGVDGLLTTYQYSGGNYDRQEREFYGYSQVIEEQRDTSSGGSVYRTITHEFNNGNYFEKGLVLQSTLADASGVVFQQTTNHYGVRGEPDGAAFPQLQQVDQDSYEGGALVHSTYTAYQYDQYGNPIRVFAANDIGTQDDVDAIIDYQYDVGSYIVSKPERINVIGGGVVLRRRESDISLGTGNITQVRSYLQSGVAAVSDIAYDQYGNVRQVTGPVNHAGQRYLRQYRYDAQANQYIDQVSDSFGYVSSADYDYRFGQVTREVDINGQAIESVYDNAGRLSSVKGPYQTSGVTLSFSYSPNSAVPWAQTNHYDNYQHSSDPITTITFVDGLGRVIQTKKDHSIASGAAGRQSVMVVSGRQLFDHVGRVVSKYYPLVEALGNASSFNYNFDGVSPTNTQYDVRDRMISTTLPDASSITVNYRGGSDRLGNTRLVKTMTDANGIATDHYIDVRGLISFIRQQNAKGGQSDIWTQYDYNAMSELLAVTDDQGNVTTSSYDHFGRRVLLDSPDAGLTENEYDLASNLVSVTTANLRNAAQQLRYEYDNTRLKRMIYPQDTSRDVNYYYGDPGASDNRVGRLMRVEDESGWTEYSYGLIGEQTRTYRQFNYHTLPCGLVCTRDYEMGYVYDTWNRLQGMVYPDGEVVHYDYDSGGALKSVTGSKDDHVYGYVSSIQYDKFGQRVGLHYGNGTVTRYEYDEADRALVGLEAKRADGSLFMDYRYSYDVVNNITAIDNMVSVLDPDTKGGELHLTYDYDDLYRLTGSTGVFYKHNRTHRYSSEMEYDRIHNFQRKQQHYQIEYADGGVIVQPAQTYDNAYSYTATQPHAPSRIGDRAYSYDDNGNQLGWDLDGSIVSRQLVWDAHNRLNVVNDRAGGVSQYIYDHTGTRSVKSAEGNLTSYVNGYYVARRGANSEAQGSKHIFAGTDRVVSKLVEGVANAALGQTQILIQQIGIGIPIVTLPPDPVEPVDPAGRDGGNLIGMTLEDLQMEALILGISFDQHVANLALNAQMSVVEYLRLFDQPPAAPQQVDELTEYLTFLAAVNGYPLQGFLEAISPTELDEMINDPFWLMIRDEMGQIWERPWEWIEVFEWWYDSETGLAQLYCVSVGEPNEFSQEVCIPKDEVGPDDGPGGGTGGGAGGGTGGDPELYERSQYYYHTNQVGSTTYLSDLYGDLYEHSLYFPFGDLWVNELGVLNPDPRFAPPDPRYLFTGKEFDQETGFSYYGARYYDPKTSIWLSPDPILSEYMNGDANGGVFNPMNIGLYSYSYQNPVKYTDQDGKLPIIPVIMGIIWVADKAYAAYEAKQDYDAIQRGEKTLTEVASERATEQAAGVVLGAVGRWSVKGGKRIWRLIKKAPCSFSAETLVAIPDGYKAISELEPGDFVLTKDEKTGEIKQRRILTHFATLHEDDQRILTVETQAGEQQVIVTSDEHPFYADGKGWLEAAKLKVGVALQTLDGETVTLIKSSRLEGSGILYDLDIEGNDNFSVGKSKVWVHNQSSDAIQFGQKRISETFRFNSDAPDWIRGKSISEVAETMKNDVTKRVNLNYFIDEHGNKVSINNRALAAYTLAGITPPDSVTSQVQPTKAELNRLKEMGNSPSTKINVTPGRNNLSVMKTIDSSGLFPCR